MIFDFGLSKSKKRSWKGVFAIGLNLKDEGLEST